MPDPLAGELAKRLETIERRLDELSRRSTGAGAPIASAELASNQSTIEFDNLPQRFHHLSIIAGVGSTASGSVGIACRVNGAAAHYNKQWAEDAGTARLGDRLFDVDNFEIGVVGPTSTGVVSTTSYATIAHYTAPTWTWLTAQASYSQGDGLHRVWLGSGCYWGATEPVTRLSLFLPGAQFTAGSVISVYGLR